MVDPSNFEKASGSVPALPRFLPAWEASVPLLQEPPVIGHGMIFVPCTDGYFRAFDLGSGRLRWQTPLASYFQAVPVLTASGQPIPQPSPLRGPVPVVTDNLLLVGGSTIREGMIFALNPRTGAILWRYVSTLDGQNQGPVLSGISVWKDRLAVRTNNGLTALRLANGRMLWNIPLYADPSCAAFSSGRAAVDFGRLFIGADLGTAAAFDLYDGRKLWESPTDSVENLGFGPVRKSNITYNRCDPLAGEGRVFTADGRGFVYALDQATGYRLWKTEVGQTWQLALHRGRLIAITAQGICELAPKNGAICRAFPMPGGAFSCATADQSLVIVPNISRIAGWSLLNDAVFRLRQVDDTFCVRYGVAASGGVVVAGGNPTPTSKATVLRAYRRVTT